MARWLVEINSRYIVEADSESCARRQVDTLADNAVVNIKAFSFTVEHVKTEWSHEDSKADKCKTCSGHGILIEKDSQACPECKGRGLK